MRRLLLLIAFACSCAPTEGTLERLGTLRGNVPAPPSGRGDAYVLVYDRPARAELELPFRVSAVPDERLREGDTRFVVGQVPPNPYRVSGFLDVGRDFDPLIDVLAQPTADDRLYQSVDVNLQPGGEGEATLTFDGLGVGEPPAFEVEADGGTFDLTDAATQLTLITVKSRAFGPLDPARVGFTVQLVDGNGDGQPDDENEDGVPDLWPQLFLRFSPKPGQTIPTDERGDLLEVIVPLLFEPGPFLSLLGGNVGEAVRVPELTCAVVPQALGLSFHPVRGRELTPLQVIPPGDYELFVLNRDGQFWRVPNQLGEGEAAKKHGGPFPSQALRFRVVRAR